MRKLVIVSSFDESCGNAVFTKVLMDSIHQYTPYAVEVIRLRLDLLQSSEKRKRQLADQHINEICNQIKKADAVNIQLEPGLYGKNYLDIITRLDKLTKQNPNTSATLHSPQLFHQRTRGLKEGITKILQANLRGGLADIFSPFFYNVTKVNVAILRSLIKNQSRLIVHTQRAKKHIKDLYGYDNVDVHPLKMVSPHEGESPLSNSLEIFKKKLGVENPILIGIFGYLCPYKGHLDALKAMMHLPKNYILMIFGGQHPHTIAPNRADPYLESLLREFNNTPTLRERVFFIGKLEQSDFVDLASQVDFVWLPYYEEGREGSGAASICFDVSKRVLASNAFLFDELLALIPSKNIQRFDIGNYLEMAQKTLFFEELEWQRRGSLDPHKIYNLKTQAELYVKELAPQASKE